MALVCDDSWQGVVREESVMLWVSALREVSLQSYTGLVRGWNYAKPVERPKNGHDEGGATRLLPTGIGGRLGAMNVAICSGHA